MRRYLRQYRDHPEFPIMYRAPWAIVAVPAMLGVAAVQCMNVLGWPFEPNPGAFLLNLIIWVSYAGAVFADIVFVRPGDGSRS